MRQRTSVRICESNRHFGKAARMRGPGYKLSGDVRRTWRCTFCGNERKLQGNVTSLMCGCREGSWMHIVAERIVVPRPIQRPSDVERRPIDFGIEPAPAAPPKPEATIVRSALSQEDRERGLTVEILEVEVITEIQLTTEVLPPADAPPPPPVETPETTDDDEWGEGIL